MSIAALVLAKHARTGLVRAMRGEGGLVLAAYYKKDSRLNSNSPLECEGFVALRSTT